MLKFTLPENAVNKAMRLLKNQFAVHKDAKFNFKAENGFRREVTKCDNDFQERLGWEEPSSDIIYATLEFLKKNNIISKDTNFNNDNIEKFRDEIDTTFKGSWTSLSYTMQNIIYMLTSIKRPENLLELGSFWGYTLAWFCGPCIGKYQKYLPNRIIGIDIDKEMCKKAKTNFSKLSNSEKVEIIAEDAQKALKNLEGPFDFVYIEAKSDEVEGLYLKLLKQVYNKLSDNAWVIAHDTTALGFKEELSEYLNWVRNTDNFKESISFEVDRYGLELSIK